MSLFRANLFFLLYLAGTTLLRATALSSPSYLMDLWTSDDDLPDTSVTAIAQTPDGYLWIGTYNGLARFDGVRFVTFDPANTPVLKHAHVTGLFTDDRGTLWINTYDNAVFSFHDGVFRREWQGAQVVNCFTTSNRIYLTTIASGVGTRIRNPQGSNQWQTIYVDGPRTAARYFCQDSTGSIWCLLNNGNLKRIENTNIVSIPNDVLPNGEKINCLTADPAGEIWAGTDKKILRWANGHFADETPTNQESAASISFLYCTASNEIWAIANRTVRHAIERRWVSSPDPSNWADMVSGDPFFIRGYAEKNGNVWFRQYGHGLFCADKNGQFSRVSTANGLPDNRVSCWYQDHEGNVWIGMDYGGLLRLRKREFEVIGDNPLKNIPVTTVCADAHSNIWFGTFDHGLNRWRDNKLESFRLAEAANRNAIFSVSPDEKGRLWLSADREDLFILETNHFFRYDTSIHGIKAILPDSRGRIWLGRQNQLTCISDGKIFNYGPNEGFERRDVRSITEDRDSSIWIGTGNGIIYRFANGIFSPFSPDADSENQPVWSLLAETNGTVWAGTFRGGLLRLKDGKFTRYTTSDGLPSDVISQILDDGFGKLWFGSYKGIFYIRKSAFDDFDHGTINSLPCIAYGLNDGLPTLQCFGNYQPTACRSSDGRLWFATVKGLVTIDPRDVQMNQLPPPVVIENLIVDDKPLGAKGSIEINPGHHQFEFDFTALSFTAPDKVRFNYRLNGFDNDWIKGGDSRTVTYGSLPPGKYTFEVIACNNDGVWNTTGASVTFFQKPFFWQTWWFIIFTSTTGVLVIAGVVSFVATRRLQRKLERFRQQRAIEVERERIAKDIHDDLGAGLTQIMFQSSLAKNASREGMQADLSQISETARDLVRNMDEIVWAINPENDTLDGLVTYVGKYVQEFLTSAKLRCRLDLPAELPAINVPAESRHNLFFAIKEVLNNVAKHANATEVLFKLQLRPGAFAFIFEDDGDGLIEPDLKSVNPSSQRISSGLGLKNLHRRLKTIGGDCVVTSYAGKGVRVELVMPCTNHKNRK